MMSEDLELLLISASVVMAASFLAAVALLALAIRQVKRFDIPPDAGFVATLQGTPLILVLGLDLLDLALDVFAAPIAWVLLDYLNLKGLRGMTVVESLIPGTQLIPTLTLSWIVARVMPDQLSQLVGDKDH